MDNLLEFLKTIWNWSGLSRLLLILGGFNTIITLPAAIIQAIRIFKKDKKIKALEGINYELKRANDQFISKNRIDKMPIFNSHSISESGDTSCYIIKFINQGKTAFDFRIEAIDKPEDYEISFKFNNSGMNQKIKIENSGFVEIELSSKVLSVKKVEVSNKKYIFQLNYQDISGNQYIQKLLVSFKGSSFLDSELIEKED